jgi:hypothetical protein
MDTLNRRAPVAILKCGRATSNPLVSRGCLLLQENERRAARAPFAGFQNGKFSQAQPVLANRNSGLTFSNSPQAGFLQDVSLWFSK